MVDILETSVKLLLLIATSIMVAVEIWLAVPLVLQTITATILTIESVLQMDQYGIV